MLYLLTKRISEEINGDLIMINKESPLQGMNQGDVATVAIQELPGLHSIDLRVTPGSPSQAAIAKALGIDFPKPGHAREGSGNNQNESYALCLAPDWWLMVGFPEAVRHIAPLLSEDQYHFSAVAISGQRTTIELQGPNAREVLAHLWEQDLRDKSFPVGSVSQGLMAKAPVIIWHIAPLHYRIMVRSSFALHLWKALVDAAEEWM
jgi:sarcosine oxidase, subunit gamma